ncbi:MAG TPA: helix-turn-helix domain-containing protein [Thermoplasmata archaeon]|nr:helix-turn-helix domain-containing protein [Thermoplasmata archaeon]
MVSSEAQRWALPDPSTLRDAPRSADVTLCPVLAAVGVIGTEWRLSIVHKLLNGPQRFSELLRWNPKLNAKTLSATLKFLERTGVVQRNVVSTRPFSVVYSLTEMGVALGPAARELRVWGERWLQKPTGIAPRPSNGHGTPFIQGELPRLPPAADRRNH